MRASKRKVALWIVVAALSLQDLVFSVTQFFLKLAYRLDARTLSDLEAVEVGWEKFPFRFYAYSDEHTKVPDDENSPSNRLTPGPRSRLL